MNNFRIIYKILKALEASLDYEETDLDAISAERLGISKPRWEQLMIMLSDAGYITGIQTARTMSDSKRHIVEPIRPVITIVGLEYLSENSVMKKMAEAAKGIVEAIT